MKVRLRADGKVISLVEFFSMYKDTSWPFDHSITTPEMINQFGTADLIVGTPWPVYNPATHKVVSDEPAFDEAIGTYRESWALQEVPPVNQISMADQVTKIQASIRQHRDQLLQDGGYKVILEDGVKWFHSDVVSQLQQMDLALEAKEIQVAGGDMNEPFPDEFSSGPLLWKTMDKSYIPMTPALALMVKAAARPQAIALHGYSKFLEDLVADVQDPKTVEIYVGWPETYVPESASE